MSRAQSMLVRKLGTEALVQSPARSEEARLISPMAAKIVAREWLFFLGMLLFGAGLLAPLLIMVVIGPHDVLDRYVRFWRAVSHREWLAWLVAVGPYFSIQLLRSVIWSFQKLAEFSITE